MSKNIYAPITPEEQAERRRALEANRQRVKEIVDSAKKCLETPEFKRYKTMYEATADTLVAEICAYSNPDPIQYAFELRDKIERLKVLRYLINTVETDASRKVMD